MPAALGRRLGSQLLSWTQDSTTAVPQALPEPKAKRKLTLLPILIVLFLVSYGLMSMLAVEQDRTISSQRALIMSLLGDSSELSHLKGRIIQREQAEAGAAARSQPQPPSAQSPMAQTPMTQAPTTQAPMAQGSPASSTKSSHDANKLRKSAPPKPPLGIADIVDGRRILKAI